MTTEVCPLWLSGSTFIPPGPSAYLKVTASRDVASYPALLGKHVEGVLTQYLDEYPGVDPSTFVLTLEPEGDHFLLCIQSSISAD